jgi:ABC-type antimicrobial peptide transport system permease subunit
VNEEFVRHYWDGGAAVGRRFAAMGRDVTVAGVVRTAKYRYVRDEPEIMVYLPVWQRMSTQLTLHAQIAGAVGPASAALSDIVRDLDPNIPVYGVGTIGDHLDAQLSNERILNALGMIFGSLALSVAAAGLYGLVAYSVARRTREIGIRMAIGARRGHIAGLFLRQALALVTMGIAIGIPLALVAGGYFESVLYAVEPDSPATLTATVAVLAVVTVVASVVPALRATRVNPTIALRD